MGTDNDRSPDMNEHASPAPRWQDVLDHAESVVEDAVGVRVCGWPLVLVRTPRGLHALSGLCPHDHAFLEGGEVDGTSLVCPRHRARFDIDSGACVAGFDLPPLKHYPVRIHEGRIQVDSGAVCRDPPLVTTRERWDLTGGR